MTTQINAYLIFNGNCKEAMTFYQQCIGGSLSLMTMGESPMADKLTDSEKEKIMHAALIREGALMLMASDNMGQEVREGNNVQLIINCTSEAELHSFFEKLSVGGQVLQAVQKVFWGALYASFKDRYGINWMLNYNLQTAS